MTARTLNPPTEKSKREAGAAFGAGLSIYGNLNVESFSTAFQTNGFASRY